VSPCSFEQFGEQTLLLIFCGPKGNGKTLRTERAMKAFVEGWMVMSGPSSTKAGMQGNSDSSNGCNCVYDEMIDELTGSDGSNRWAYLCNSFLQHSPSHTCFASSRLSLLCLQDDPSQGAPGQCSIE